MNITLVSRFALAALFAVSACMPLRADDSVAGPIMTMNMTDGQTIHQSDGYVYLSATATDAAGLRYLYISGANRTLINTFSPDVHSVSAKLGWSVKNYPVGDYTFKCVCSDVNGQTMNDTFTIHLAP